MGMRHELFDISMCVTTRPKEEPVPEPIDNTVEKEVLQKVIDNGCALYNGVPVIQGLVDEKVGFSAGIIFIGKAVEADDSGAALLRHEYGHVLHLSQVGWESYIMWVVVPSVAGFLKGTKYGVYFSQPFEYIADMLGGVVRTDGAKPYVYADDAQERAEAYWQFTYDYVGVFPYG